MKIRKGFVTNSSSTCFVVLFNDANKISPKKLHSCYEETMSCFVGDALDLTKLDNDYTEFGWGFIKYNSYLHKLAFAVILASYKDDWRDFEIKNDEKRFNFSGCVIGNKYTKKLRNTRLLQSIIQETLGINFKRIMIDGYIDHQSYEDGMNVDIFKDETTLKNFLFGTSYFKTGNDNEDGPDGWYDDCEGGF